MEWTEILIDGYNPVPEYLERILDGLTKEDLKSVIDFELSKVRERLLERGLAIELTDEAKEFLVRKGSNLDYGARPLRRAIESFIEDPLAEELLKGEFAGKDTIKVDIKKVGDKKQLVFDGIATEKQEKPEPVGAVVADESDAAADSEPPATTDE